MLYAELTTSGHVLSGPTAVQLALPGPLPPIYLSIYLAVSLSFVLSVSQLGLTPSPIFLSTHTSGGRTAG